MVEKNVAEATDQLASLAQAAADRAARAHEKALGYKEATVEIAAEVERLRNNSKLTLHQRLVHNPLLSGLIGGVIAVLLGGFVQFLITKDQGDREDEIRAGIDQRRQLALAIVMASELADVRAAVRTYSEILQEPVYAQVVKSWRLPGAGMQQWGSDDLSLFDKDFLSNYGTLANTLDTANSNIELIRWSYDDKEVGQLISSEHADRLKFSIGQAAVYGEVLHSKLMEIYETAK